MMLRPALLLFALLSVAHCQWETTTRKNWNWVTTSQAPFAELGQCGCSHKNIWLDIIFVVDASSSMTKQGLSELNNYVLTALDRLTISNGNILQSSRVGLVTYSDSALLVNKLTDFANNDDLFNRYNPAYMSASGSNIESAISLAQDELSSSRHRSNAQRVIVIAASHYEPGSWSDPTEVATQFKGNGGIIITLEYVQTHGTTVPILDTLASPCYTLTNRFSNLTANDLVEKFCMANCFCIPNWNAYSANNNQCNLPDGGCYLPVTIPSSYRLAKRQCEREANGTTIIVSDAQKAVYLASLTTNKQQTWLGLSYNGFKWIWNDGSDLGSYQPWASFNFEPNQCAYQQQTTGFKVSWYNDDCDDDHVYTCQATPCSSDHYCTF